MPARQAAQFMKDNIQLSGERRTKRNVSKSQAFTIYHPLSNTLAGLYVAVPADVRTCIHSFSEENSPGCFRSPFLL